MEFLIKLLLRTYHLSKRTKDLDKQINSHMNKNDSSNYGRVKKSVIGYDVIERNKRDFK